MEHVAKKLLLASTSTLVAFALLLPGVGRASTIIESGFDLYQTLPPTGFSIVSISPIPISGQFAGVPLGSFDFGSGPIGVSNTNMIVERTQVANLAGGSDTIDIEIVALSLVSVAPMDLGFGAGFENISLTLNTSSPSLQSTMTITDDGEGSPHGTYSSLFNVSLDLSGSVGGFYTTLETFFTTEGNDWQHAPPPGAALIDGVNHLLNTTDESGDFWAPGTVTNDWFSFTDAGVITVAAAVPEPSSAALFALGLVGITVVRRRRREPPAGLTCCLPEHRVVEGGRFAA